MISGKKEDWGIVITIAILSIIFLVILIKRLSAWAPSGTCGDPTSMNYIKLTLVQYPAVNQLRVDFFSWLTNTTMHTFLMWIPLGNPLAELIQARNDNFINDTQLECAIQQYYALGGY